MTLRLSSCWRLFVSLTLIATAVSCTAAPASSSAWRAQDVRRLDAAGNAPFPAGDIIAVLARSTEQELQIRVDLLDLEPGSQYLLVLEVYEDQSAQPLRLEISAQGSKVSLPPGHALLTPRIVRDPALDAITVSFRRSLLKKPRTISVSTLSPGEAGDALNALAGIPVDGDPPGQAQVLIAFTEVFQASTPVQAVRRWDGAHTGPTGERHGLRHILEAVRSNGLPVVLADLKTPEALGALEFVGGMDLVRPLAAEHLLVLPDVAQAEPAQEALEISRLTGSGFGLAETHFSYSAAGGTLPGADYQFARLEVEASPVRLAGTVLLPLGQAHPPAQVTVDGPTLALRQALVEAALDPDPARLLVLGGSLPGSNWGDSDMAEAGFRWLAAHPWIHVLDEKDLRRLPAAAVENYPLAPGAPLLEDPFLPALQDAPENTISASAWQVHFLLTAPTENAALQALRAQYLGQIGILLEAAAWAQAPTALRSCELDPDLDGMPECILANEDWFAVLAPDGGRLTHLFFGETQVIASTAQFAVGLSDPSEWGRQPGDGADPAQLMGAFGAEAAPFSAHAVTWAQDTLTLADPALGVSKTFRLGAGGLEVSIQGFGTSVSIPLAVDPGRFYASQVEYRARLAPDSWTWGPADGVRVQVRTLAPFLAQGFTSSLPYLGIPENPDFDYPAAHYFPFPMALVRIQPEAEFSVQIGLP